ncbi:MAG: flavin reductase [Dehalococcoidia bacterium]|jgi:flavin reductase (DIM6/NTAB) family NADH-FMN oxidoreductase RutF|nr:flavin reductase [Dehalococcoidia bacterium]
MASVEDEARCVMADEGVVDSRLFRDVMGTFASGVTVVTLGVDGTPRGMTANAFLSLSLDPPLVIVCVQETGSMHSLFEEAEAFGVNVLAADQRAVSDLFAKHGMPDEPMGGFEYRVGDLGVPLLSGVLGYAECRIVERLPGGDHTIVIGEATNVAFDREGAEPLLFYRGGYREISAEA